MSRGLACYGSQLGLGPCPDSIHNGQFFFQKKQGYLLSGKNPTSRHLKQPFPSLIEREKISIMLTVMHAVHSPHVSYVLVLFEVSNVLDPSWMCFTALISPCNLRCGAKLHLHSSVQHSSYSGASALQLGCFCNFSLPPPPHLSVLIFHYGPP